jgi:hypothetical protein
MYRRWKTRTFFQVKQLLSDSSNDVCTVYYTDKTGVYYGSFLGAKILDLNSRNGSVVEYTKADFTEVKGISLTSKVDKDTQSVSLDSLFTLDDLFGAFRNSNPEDGNVINRFGYNVELMIMASLTAPFLQMLDFKPLVIGVNGRLGYNFSRFATSFWSNPNSLDVIEDKKLKSSIADYNGFAVSMPENEYKEVSALLNRGYSSSKLNTISLTAFHYAQGGTAIQSYNKDELYLRTCSHRKNMV